MKQSFAGIWIDHSQAVVVIFERSSEVPRILRIESDIEPVRWPRSRQGRRRAGGVSHTRLDERRRTALNRYYRQVLDSVRGIPRLTILGPGTAKRELKAAIDRERSCTVEVGPIAAAGRLTDRQLVARLRAQPESAHHSES